MVLTRARAKALAVGNRRQCITVTEEPEDPGIPTLVRRRSCELRMVVNMATKQQAKLVEKLAKRNIVAAKRKENRGRDGAGDVNG
ncbi:dihydrodipicolinate synthase family protein [Sesbania bispinosa]|nr:dihydrodipicolinate synthase family protein [Sesbania bispinosa]